MQLLLPTRESEVRSRRRKRERKRTTLTIGRARAMMEKAKLFPPHGATTRNVATIVLCVYLVRPLRSSLSPPLLPHQARSDRVLFGLYITREEKELEALFGPAAQVEEQKGAEGRRMLVPILPALHLHSRDGQATVGPFTTVQYEELQAQFAQHAQLLAQVCALALSGPRHLLPFARSSCFLLVYNPPPPSRSPPRPHNNPTNRPTAWRRVLSRFRSVVCATMIARADEHSLQRLCLPAQCWSCRPRPPPSALRSHRVCASLPIPS
jgi:hypothetical protein